MFNTIETLPNHFTRELLPDYLSSKVALHFNANYWQLFWVISCLEEVLLTASDGPVSTATLTV